MTIPSDKLAALKSAHPNDELHVVTFDDLDFVVKAPSKGVYKLHSQASSDPANRYDANERLVRACVVHPEAKELGDLIDRKPGIVVTLVGELLELSGISAKAQRVKL